MPNIPKIQPTRSWFYGIIRYAKSITQRLYQNRHGKATGHAAEYRISNLKGRVCETAGSGTGGAGLYKIVPDILG